MNERPHILIIEDDVEIRALLRDYLAREGFRVEVGHGGAALDRFRATFGEPDLVVLDIMLPGEDGLSICRRVRAGSRVPILMLTAKGEDIDRIVGLEMGADDYLPKPFNPRELVARIRAILRRSKEGKPSAGGRIEVGGISLDPGTREVTVNGKPVDFTTFEFDILELLMRNAGRVLSRDALMENFYNRKATPFDRSIDMHISHLRKKLENGEALIKTIRGVGYQFSRGGEDTAFE